MHKKIQLRNIPANHQEMRSCEQFPRFVNLVIKNTSEQIRWLMHNRKDVLSTLEDLDEENFSLVDKNKLDITMKLIKYLYKNKEEIEKVMDYITFPPTNRKDSKKAFKLFEWYEEHLDFYLIRLCFHQLYHWISEKIENMIEEVCQISLEEWDWEKLYDKDSNFSFRIKGNGEKYAIIEYKILSDPLKIREYINHHIEDKYSYEKNFSIINYLRKNIIIDKENKCIIHWYIPEYESKIENINWQSFIKVGHLTKEFDHKNIPLWTDSFDSKPRWYLNLTTNEYIGPLDDSEWEPSYLFGEWKDWFFKNEKKLYHIFNNTTHESFEGTLQNIELEFINKNTSYDINWEFIPEGDGMFEFGIDANFYYEKNHLNKTWRRLKNEFDEIQKSANRIGKKNKESTTFWLKNDELIEYALKIKNWNNWNKYPIYYNNTLYEIQLSWKSKELIINTLKIRNLSPAEIIKEIYWKGKIFDIPIWQDSLDYLDRLLRGWNISIPKELIGNLRNYQKEWYNILYRNSKLKFGTLLADDMWLWKTIQLITLLLKLKEEWKTKKPSLLVCPNNGLITRHHEIKKFAPTLKYFTYHWLRRNLSKIDKDNDLIITTYWTLREDSETIKDQEFWAIILDEGQIIKNRNTKISKIARSLISEIRIVSTGTPIENQIDDMWSIFDFIMPGYLWEYYNFKQKYSSYKHSLKKDTKPFTVRRMKKEVAKELPDKVISNKFCKLSNKQIELYKKAVGKVLKDIITGNRTNEAKKNILQLTHHVKQICNHPSHYLKNNEWKLEDSPKAKILIDDLRQIIPTWEKVLIFSQYVEMLKWLEIIINRNTWYNTLTYDWSLSDKSRKNILNQFENESDKQILLISLKAWWNSLNLQSANHVYLYDRRWNYATERQAIDRVFRIWQDKKVFVNTITNENSFEEKMIEIISRKQLLADENTAEWSSWLGSLNNTELKELFSLWE